ncbi:unnamed protein product [Caenorhabditis auriculariae]|uniref:Coiled-coil domain-containing protein 132 n=1 Tax=Caenorhabditis auriculariae TaxID=2777116 RepID=A0A8S1H264_9PELO|nr:unnamed protein product [Caenorhabditis auriculariae]
MNKLKETLSRKVQDLGESLSIDEDVRMEDMSEFVLSPYEGPSTSEFLVRKPVIALTKNSVTRTRSSEQKTDDEVIENIDAAYFVEHDFDAIGYELTKLFDIEMCYEDISREHLRLKSQLQVVSKRISNLIMQKSPSYGAQISDMEKIRQDLIQIVVFRCGHSKVPFSGSLSVAKEQSTTALRIIANEKKKYLLKNLRRTLLTLKTFYESEYRIQEVIQEGQFPLAIRMCVEAQDAAKSFRHFSCVNDVVTKLAGISSLLETELSKSLDTLVMVFDQDRYAFVFNAYEMLNKVEDLPSKLVASFHAALENSSQAVLLDKMSARDSKNDSSNNGLKQNETSYAKLCMELESDQLVVTLRELGFVLCRTLCAFHSFLRFHSEEEDRREQQREAEDVIDVPKLRSINAELRESRKEIFTTALNRMMSLLESREFVVLKFDHILDIVDMVNRFRSVGRTYFGHPCAELARCIERQTSAYFSRYHRERMEELAMFIENESFTLCPVSAQFTIFDLQDFEFLKESREEREREAWKEALASTLSSEQLEGVLMPSEWKNPFSVSQIKSRHQSSYSVRSEQRHSSSTYSDANDFAGVECSEDPLAENPPNSASSQPAPPNACNTSLNLLRFFGRYIRMTALLPSVCDRSAPAVADLFELFFASLVHLFGNDGSEFVERPARLDVVISSIHRRLSGASSSSSSSNAKTSSPFKTALFRGNSTSGNDLRLPSLCPAVQLGFIDTLFGAAERIIAIESLEFTARQLDLVRPVIESLYPESKTDALVERMESFYSQVLPSVADVRLLLVDAVASRALRISKIVESVAATKWDIAELRSHHSSYVDLVLQDFEAFRLRVSTVEERQVNVTEATQKLFWNRAIYYTFKALVQGYCEGGKCSTEGRALMQLDFQNILIKLEPISGMRPVPHAAFVDSYIKAYYLPESGLEQWIASHSEYSPKQLVSLLGAAAHVSKKARVRILSALNS